MAEIYIYDVIGEDFFGDGLTANTIRKELAAIGPQESITVKINSPGGDFHQAMAIRSLLLQHKGTVSAHVDGLAASAASILAMQPSLTIAEGGMLMIHDPWTITVGNKAEHQRTVESLEKHAQTAAELYAKRSGGTVEDFRAAMAAETWYTASEAVDVGLADSVTNTPVMSCPIDARFGYRNADRWKIRLPEDADRNILTIEALQRRLNLTRQRAAM